MTLRFTSLLGFLALSLTACGDDDRSGDVTQSSTPSSDDAGDDDVNDDDAENGTGDDESTSPATPQSTQEADLSSPGAPNGTTPNATPVPNVTPLPNATSAPGVTPTPGGPGGSGNGGDGSGNASGSGAAGGGEAPGGRGNIPECEQVQCLRAFECVRECGATPEYVGCCPCEEGTIDAISCSASNGGAANGGAANGGAGNGGGECSALLDPVIDSAALTITVTNERTVPIGLGGPVSCQPTLFTLRSQDATLVWGGDHCSFTCEMLMAGAGGCTADCPSPEPIILQPGESDTIEWHGVVQRITQLPSKCCAEIGLCPAECGVLQAAGTGQYVATLAVVELTVEQAAVCEEQPFAETCPGAFNGSGNPASTTDVPFQITSRDEPVTLTIE